MIMWDRGGTVVACNCVMRRCLLFVLWGGLSGVICGLFIHGCRDIGGVSVYRGIEYGGEGSGMWDGGELCVL